MAERQVTIRVRADGSNIVQTFRLMGAEGERALGQIRTAANSQKQSFDNLGRSMAQTRTQSTAFNGGMRGVALQLSQVGQQTIATGDFIKSLAIQLPDLALGFGALGIAAGVVAGAVLPLVANALFDTEEKGGELKDRMTELEAVTKQYQASVERLRSPMADLREEFGKNAQAARALFEIDLQRDQINLITSIGAARKALSEQVGAAPIFSPESLRAAGSVLDDLLARLAELRDGAEPIGDDEGLRIQQAVNDMGRLSEAVTKVSADLNISSAEAGELLATFAELNAAQGPQAQLEAVARLRTLYFEAAAANGELTDEENNTLNALRDVEISLLRVIAGTDQVAESARGGAENVASIANEMSRAANEALRFVSNLGSASLAGVRAEVAALEGGGSRTDARVARREAEIRSSDEFKTALQGPEGLRQSALQGLQREIELTREAAALDERRASALKELNDIGKGSSGGGGAGRSLQELNEVARQTESIINQARQAAVGYADVVSFLDEALRSGKISQDDYNRALDLAKERFDKVGEGAREAQEDFKDFAKSALTDIDGIGDALDQLGSRLLSRGFDTLFDSIFPSAGGGGGKKGLLGLGGFLGFLDGGGPIKAGEFAVVGERRPEIVTGPASVIGGAETARLMRSSGSGGGTATLRIIAPAGFDVDMDGKIAGIAVQVVRNATPSIVGSSVKATYERAKEVPIGRRK